MLLRSLVELQIFKKRSVVSLLAIEHPKHIRLDCDDAEISSKWSDAARIVILLLFVFLSLQVWERKLFWFVSWVVAASCACLARQRYILSGPPQRSSEPCRNMFLHVLAELCKCAASYSHSADTPQECPPAHTRIIPLHLQSLSALEVAAS